MTSLGGLKLAEGVVVGCAWIGPLGGEAGRGVHFLTSFIMILLSLLFWHFGILAFSKTVIPNKHGNSATILN